MTEEKHLRFEIDEGVGIVTLNRPERLNAVTWDLARDLVELFRDLRARDEVRVLVLSGAGRAFCSGGDAEWISGGSEQRGLPGLSDLPLERFQRKTPAGPIGEFTRMIVEVDKPVIAAVQGAVMGAGLAFALACDRRFADTTSRWCAAMVRLGFAPDCGITYFLPRVTRLSTALMMVETGRILEAREAHAEGLIDELVEGGQALPTPLAYAKRLAGDGELLLLHAPPSLADAAVFASSEGLWAPREPLETIDDRASARARELLKVLADRGVEIFFPQVMAHNFFHADMHPGNIFVEPNGRYISVDFGIVGTLTKQDQRYLAENLLAFFRRDYRRVAELHVESGWVPRGTRVEEFESAIRTVCEPIFEKPLSEISFGSFLVNLFQTARRFDMEIQPQLVLLEKTLLNIEGLGRQLYPQLDLWTTAKPFMERWMREQVGPRMLARRLAYNWPTLADRLPELPVAITRIVDHLDQQANLGLDGPSADVQDIRNELKSNNRRTLATLAAVALAGLATALLLVPQPPSTMPLVAPTAAAVLIVASLALLWRGLLAPSR